MLFAGRKLTGCPAVLCLPARPSRLGLHKRSRIRRSGHVSVANMAQRQPAGEGELPRAQAYYVNSAGMPRLFSPLLDARARALLPPAEEPSIAPIPSAAAESPRPSPGWDAVDLRAAPLTSSLARSGTVDRGRAQRARYLDDEDEPRTGRSRSRSVSRSRSRSRSPSPGVRPLPYAPKHWFPEPTAFVMMQSQSDIAAYAERKVTLSYDQVDRFVRTGEVGPKTRFAIDLLFNAAFIVFISDGTTFEHDAAHPFPVGQLADLCHPNTMPLPTLVNLIYSVYQAEEAAEVGVPAGRALPWVRI